MAGQIETRNGNTSRRRSTWIYLGGNQIFVLLVIARGFVLIPVCLKYIQVETYGAWLAISGVLTLITLSDFGLNSLLIQKTSVLYGGKDYEGLGRTVASILIATAFLSAVACGLIWGCAPWIPGWLGITGKSTVSLTLAFRLAALDAMLMMSALGLGATLVGLQRPFIHMLGMSVTQVAGLVATLLALWQGWGILAIPAGLLSGTLLLFLGNAVALGALVRRNFPAGLFRFDLPTLKGLMKSSLLLFVSRLCSLFTNRSAGMIVALVLSLPMVVVLEVTRKPVIAVVDLLMRLPASLLPGLSHLLGSGEKERFQSLIGQIFRYILLLGLLCVGGVMLLNRAFVSLWTGKQFYGGDFLTFLICLYALAEILNSTAINIVFATGRFGVITLASIFQSVFMVSLALILGYLWGLYGVALAMLVASLASFGILGRDIVKLLELRCFETSTLLRLIKMFGPAILLGILGLATSLVWPPQGWWQILAYGFGYVLLGGTVLLALDRQLRRTIAFMFSLRGSMQ